MTRLYALCAVVCVLSLATMLTNCASAHPPELTAREYCDITIAAGLAGNSEYVEDPWMPAVRTVRDAEKTCARIFGEDE